MTGVLRDKIGGSRRARRTHRGTPRNTFATRKRRGIPIVPEVKPYWANRCLVPYPQANCMRNVAVITLAGSFSMQAQLRIFLVPAQQVVQHAVTAGKHVTRIMKEGEAQIVLEKGEGRRRNAELKVIDKKSSPSQGESCDRITRSRLI